MPKKYSVANVKDRLPKLAEWVNHKYFENTMQKLINGYDLRKKMTHAATKNFDDKGSHRVLMKLSKLI